MGKGTRRRAVGASRAVSMAIAKHPALTPFARKVYRAVLRIPLGEVRTYGWVACRAGSPRAARAVGQLMKRNPYPPLIPCHRVVASGGAIGGYVFGGRAKERLLKIERHIRESMV